MQITKEDLKNRVHQKWHDRLDGLYANLSQTLASGSLPHGWFAASWIKNPSFYQKNRSAISKALDEGFVFDDAGAPLPMPK